MGVVGRQLLRKMFEKNFEVSVINDASISKENLVYLLKHDSIYHESSLLVTSGETANHDYIEINGKQITFLHEPDPANVNWGDYANPVIIECTELFNSREKLEVFINGGAIRAIAVYPLTDAGALNIVYGVNQDTLTGADTRIGMLSVECQVGTIALNVLNTANGVNYAYANAFTSYTNAQNTIDSMVRSGIRYQQGRAGAWNIVPYGPNQIRRAGLIIPALNGHISGMNYRAPIIDGGAMDIVADLNGAFDPTTFLAALKATGLVESSDDPLVSSDMVGKDQCSCSSQYIMTLSKTDGGSFVRCTILYDNIQFQVAQTIRLLEYLYPETN